MKCFCEFDLFQWLPWWLHSDTFRKCFFIPAASDFTSFHCLHLMVLKWHVHNANFSYSNTSNCRVQTGFGPTNRLLSSTLFAWVFNKNNSGIKKTRTLMSQWETRWTWRHKDTIKIKQEVLQNRARETRQWNLNTKRRKIKQINTFQKLNHGN